LQQNNSSRSQGHCGLTLERPATTQLVTWVTLCRKAQLTLL